MKPVRVSPRTWAKLDQKGGGVIVPRKSKPVNGPYHKAYITVYDEAHRPLPLIWRPFRDLL